LSRTAGKYRIQFSFWAGRKIDDLMSQDLGGLQRGNMKPELQKEITQLGLEYHLVTQFTSFVAVEEQVITKDGKPQRVEVPVEMPEGVSYEGVFGDEKAWLFAPNARLTLSRRVSKSPSTANHLSQPSGIGSDAGGGFVAGASGGVVSGIYGNQPPAPPPPVSQQQVVVTNGEVAALPPVADEKPTGERAVLESKLDPSLLAAFDCWKKSGWGCNLVKDGVIEIQLWLTDDSSVVLEQLKAVSFTPSENRQKEKVVVGHIPAEKLADLARIGAVRFVSPVRR
jgi:hypothetical protein